VDKTSNLTPTPAQAKSLLNYTLVALGAAQSLVAVSADCDQPISGRALPVVTRPALDPQSRMPEFKACAVAIDRHGGPDDPISLDTGRIEPTGHPHTKGT